MRNFKVRIIKTAVGSMGKVPLIKELQKNPELALDENVWKQFTTGLPKNQRLVVHSDDSVDFFRQTEFGPHNIENITAFQKKHPFLSREEATKITKMEPEDQVLEVTRLERIYDKNLKQKNINRIQKLRDQGFFDKASGGIAGELHLHRPGYNRGKLVDDLVKLYRGESKLRSKMDFGINRGTYYTPQKDFARYIAQGGSQSQGRLIGDLFGKVKSLKVPKKLIEEAGGSMFEVNIRDPNLLKAAKTDILQTIMARAGSLSKLALKGLSVVASLPAQVAVMTLTPTDANADEINMQLEDFAKLAEENNIEMGPIMDKAKGGIAGQLKRPGYESGREVLPQQEIYEEELEKRGGFTGDPLYYFLGPGIETLKYKWPRSLLKEIIDNYRDIPEERLPEDYNTDFGKQLRKRDLSRFKKDRRPIRKKIKEQEIAKGGLAKILGV